MPSLARCARRTRVVEVIVVDNGSSDGSADAVAAAHPDLALIPLDANLGFAGGMNVGIAEALSRGAGPVMLLNNDTVVEPGFLEPLVDALESRSDASAACSQIVFRDDPATVWYAGASFRPGRGHHGSNRGYGRPRLAATTPPFVTDRACGGAMLVPAAALAELGDFDESLFAYAEDTDWSLRSARAGLTSPGRPGERRPACRVRRIRGRVLARHALLRPPKRPRGRRALGAARPAAKPAPSRGSRRGPPRAGVAVGPPESRRACRVRRLARPPSGPARAAACGVGSRDAGMGRAISREPRARSASARPPQAPARGDRPARRSDGSEPVSRDSLGPSSSRAPSRGNTSWTSRARSCSASRSPGVASG